MKIQSLPDLAKRVDRFPMTWLYEGQLIEKELLRESPKNSELAHYLNVLRRLHAGSLTAKTEVEKAEWLVEVKDDLFLYFCEDNQWVTRDMLNPVSQKKTIGLLEQIASVVADLAEEDANEKKKLEPWETYEAGLRKYLEVTNSTLVEFLECRYYRFVQEVSIRTTPTTEEEYKEKNKVKVMDIKDILPF